jgi:DNA-binding response OmpR family regulator
MTPRILIVDDDPDMVQLLCIALTAAGFSVRTAANGEEALLMALRSPPDLLVLDLLLPGMNGFSVCERLRLNPATAAVPIVMITVLTGEFPRLVGAEAGADAYLNKPFGMDELVSCVRSLVHRHGGVADALTTPSRSRAGDAMPQFPEASPESETVLRMPGRA